MKKKFSLLLAICLTATILLSGCGGTASSASKTSSSGEIKVTDLCDREVTLPKAAEKVVLTFNFEEYFAVTGEEGVAKIAGWSKKYWEGRRQSTWDVFTSKFPQLKELPDVGYVPKSTFNAETVISLQPDLVIMAKNDFETVKTDLQRLDAAGIPVVFVDYHQQTMENHEKSTLLIGQVMGEEERAKELVDFYKEQTALVTERIAKAGANLAKPSVYMEFSEATGPSTFGASYGKQMWGAIIEQCGGKNIAKDLVEGASAAIMPEQILAANPEVVIFAGNQFADSNVNVGLGYTSDKETAKKNLASYATRQGWNELNAVKSGKMYGLYHDLSRHIFDFAGLQYIAKSLHPELFKELDPEVALKEFHERFYPVDYTGAWFVEMEE